MISLKTGVDNYIFWSEIGSGFEGPGGTYPPRIPRSTPPPPPRDYAGDLQHLQPWEQSGFVSRRIDLPSYFLVKSTCL